MIEGYKRRWRLSAAKRAGLGRYTNGWHFSGDPETDAERILGWLRETVANCRRPYGFASFDLALQLEDGAGRERRLRFERWEPEQLYRDDATLIRELKDFLAREASRVSNGRARVVAVLSSWGDLAHAVLAN